MKSNRIFINGVLVFLHVHWFLFSIAQSQVANTDNWPYPLVQVLDWSKRGIINGDDFYANTKDQIIRQIGEVEFNKLEKHDDVYGWPQSLRKNLFDRTDTAAQKKVDANFEKLKVYKIVTYTHIFEGKNWGKYVILKAPYKENSFLDSPGKWEAIYFVMKEEYAKEIR
ncbi:hypothetical protein [Longitalea arenae]|uniref:hypothetical protein n=1 Tax=Longitalea arenae TaxID=2812558 RepID=UPI001967FF11|nr:hypothetical protein [Longitalea arenae]